MAADFYTLVSIYGKYPPNLGKKEYGQERSERSEMEAESEMAEMCKAQVTCFSLQCRLINGYGSSTFNCYPFPAQIRRSESDSISVFVSPFIAHRAMARSKWISFRAQEQLDRAASQATNPSTALPLLSCADAKKFGLENVWFIINSSQFCFAQPLLTNYVSLTSSAILGEHLNIFIPYCATLY